MACNSDGACILAGHSSICIESIPEELQEKRHSDDQSTMVKVVIGSVRRSLDFVLEALGVTEIF